MGSPEGGGGEIAQTWTFRWVLLIFPPNKTHFSLVTFLTQKMSEGAEILWLTSQLKLGHITTVIAIAAANNGLLTVKPISFSFLVKKIVRPRGN